MTNVNFDKFRRTISSNRKWLVSMEGLETCSVISMRAYVCVHVCVCVCFACTAHSALVHRQETIPLYSLH